MGTISATRNHPVTGKPQYQVVVNDDISGGRDQRGGYFLDDLYPPDHDFTPPDPTKGQDISDEQIESLREYSISAYGDVNRRLRGLPERPDRDDAAIDAHIANIDAAIAANRVSTEEVYTQSATGEVPVFRGLKLSDFGVDSLDELAEGIEVQNHGFISTSKRPGVAAEFAARRGETGFVMMVHTGPESRGVDLSGFGMDDSEDETLLARGSRFRVRAVHRDHPAGKWNNSSAPVVEVEHIDPHGQG